VAIDERTDKADAVIQALQSAKPIGEEAVDSPFLAMALLHRWREAMRLDRSLPFIVVLATGPKAVQNAVHPAHPLKQEGLGLGVSWRSIRLATRQTHHGGMERLYLGNRKITR
jgi:hypothetical protein